MSLTIPAVLIMQYAKQCKTLHCQAKLVKWEGSMSAVQPTMDRTPIGLWCVCWNPWKPTRRESINAWLKLHVSNVLYLLCFHTSTLFLGAINVVYFFIIVDLLKDIEFDGGGPLHSSVSSPIVKTTNLFDFSKQLQKNRQQLPATILTTAVTYQVVSFIKTRF